MYTIKNFLGFNKSNSYLDRSQNKEEILNLSMYLVTYFIYGPIYPSFYNQRNGLENSKNSKKLGLTWSSFKIKF